ncbi:MAG: type II toxin-antitoxin system PemK/MazF family toxin [bacterium]|nr:type II toxin-antitoxin system PemK/MazF family toxin [bacterium]
MKMKPGDIWVVEIPALGTHEQSGIRPAVIVARVAKTIVTIIPCTSNQEALRFPFTHPIEPTKQNGLTAVSVALIFHMRALDAGFLKRRIGELDKKTLADIRRLARRLIG